MFGLVRRRLRARWDYLRFVTTRHWPIGAGLAGLLLGVATLAPNAWGLALSVVALVLGAGTLARDLTATSRQWSRLQCVAVVTPFPTESVPPPVSYSGARYLRVPNRGTMLVHPDTDRALRAAAMPVVLDPEPYLLPANLREVAPVALRTIGAGRVIFDGPMLGLFDDPLPPVGPQPRPLRLRRVSFFKQICSAELCQYRVVDRDTGAEWDVRRSELIDPAGRLVTLAGSRLANNVGVSTIAVTVDGLVIVVAQSARNIASARLLAPSGSGTLEPRDLTAAGPGAGLQEVVVRGMERELCEETGIRASDVLGTEVVGFGRWLERGAKPEFFGLTRLTLSAEEVRRARITGAERLYTERVTLHHVDLGRLRSELTAGQPLDEAASLPGHIRDSGSLPLLMGLRAAALAGPGPAGPTATA